MYNIYKLKCEADSVGALSKVYLNSTVACWLFLIPQPPLLTRRKAHYCEGERSAAELKC